MKGSLRPSRYAGHDEELVGPGRVMRRPLRAALPKLATKAGSSERDDHFVRCSRRRFVQVERFGAYVVGLDTGDRWHAERRGWASGPQLTRRAAVEAMRRDILDPHTEKPS